MTAQVGRYELLQRLSGGGMGEVFLARVVGVEGFAKQVAVKRIYPDRSGDYEVRKLFVREAKLVAQLDHPNIVQVLELGADGDDLYMAMEFVQGVDLRHLIKQLRQNEQLLTSEQTLVIAQDVIAALEHAHAFIDEAQTISGIIHADVSPHNIMVTVQGFAKLCDFGVAKILRQTNHETTMRGHWGKVAYMAPEQVRDRHIDKRTDVYALGAVLYELFAGKRMLDSLSPEAMMKAVVNGDILPLADVRPDLAPRLCDVIQKACAADPEKRWDSVAALRNALANAAPPLDVAKARRELADLVRNSRPSGDVTTATQSTTNSDEPETDSHEGFEPTRVIELSPPLIEPPVREVRASRLKFVAGAGVIALAIVAVVAVRVSITDTTAPVADIGAPQTSAAPPVATAAIAAPQANPVAPAMPALLPSPTRPQAKASRPKPATAPGHDSAPSAEPAHLTINAVPWAHVIIDGVLVKDTPILNHPLTPGRHTIELRRPSGQKVELPLNLRPGESVKKIIEFGPE